MKTLIWGFIAGVCFTVIIGLSAFAAGYNVGSTQTPRIMQSQQNMQQQLDKISHFLFGE